MHRSKSSPSVPKAADGAPRRDLYLTEEHEHAHVELQKSGDAERPSLRAAQRIKQQLSAQCTLPLLRPHVDLLLAVSERTVLPVLTLLTLLHLCRTQRGGKRNLKHTSAVPD